MPNKADERDGSHEWEDDRPMTEQEWEAFMKKADLRSARFGELMETLMNDPDRYAKVSREMGWDVPDSEEVEPEEGGFNPAEIIEGLNEEDLEEARRELEQSDRELEQIPAYQKGMALSERVMDLLKPLHDRSPGKNEELDELISQATVNAMIPAVRISGGHAMGYDEESLGGNIVKNKQALEAANLCCEAWQELRRRRLIEEKTADSVLEQIADLRQEIEQRLAELRGRVWW